MEDHPYSCREALNRLAVIAAVIEDRSSVSEFNETLHEYSECIIGRMGLPCRSKNVSLISLALDAPQNKINTLAGRLGRIKGIRIKTVFASDAAK